MLGLTVVFLSWWSKCLICYLGDLDGSNWFPRLFKDSHCDLQKVECITETCSGALMPLFTNRSNADTMLIQFSWKLVDIITLPLRHCVQNKTALSIAVYIICTTLLVNRLALHYCTSCNTGQLYLPLLHCYNARAYIEMLVVLCQAIFHWTTTESIILYGLGLENH